MASFLDSIKSALGKVKKEASLFGEAFTDTQKETQAKFQSGEDQGFIKNISGAVGTLGSGIADIYKGGKAIVSGEDASVPLTNASTKLSSTLGINPITKLAGEVIGGPVGDFVKGAGKALDIPGNYFGGLAGVSSSGKGLSDAIAKGDASEATRNMIDIVTRGISTGLSVLPSYMTIRSVAGGTMEATGANKAIERGSENLKKNEALKEFGDMFGLDEKTRTDWIDTGINVVRTIPALFGAKFSPLSKTQVGKALGKTSVTLPEMIKANAIQAMKGAAVTSSGDAFISLFDDGSGKDTAIANAGNFVANALMPGVFPGIKALKGKQTQLDIDTPAKSQIDETPIVQKLEEAPAKVEVPEPATSTPVETSIPKPKKAKTIKETVVEATQQKAESSPVVIKTSDTSGQIKEKGGILDYELVDGRMEIDGVQVDTNSKRSGIGTRLMQEAENQARKEGAKVIRLVAMPLDAATTHDALDNFYTKLGYEKQEGFEHVYQKSLDTPVPVKAETPVPVKTESPDIYSRQKSELQQAQDNLNRYEDYARRILATRKMPNGKKVTKKDAEFLKSEYKRLVDARDNAMRTVGPKEEVPLADNAGVMVRDKQFLLPERTPETAYQDKRAQMLSDLEKARDEYFLKEEDNAMMNRLADENSARNSTQELESMKFSGITGSDIPAYLRTGEFPSTQTMSESVPVQTAFDRKLLGIDPTANPPKTPGEPTVPSVPSEGEGFPNRTDRDISDMDAEKLVTQTVMNNLPTNRAATLGNGPIASAVRGAIGRAYDFVVSSRLGGDTLSVDVGGKKLPFTQFLDTTRRGIAGAIRNNITRSLKLNEQYAPLADSAVELKPEYLIGKSFPDFNGGKVIDADMAAKIIETQKYSDAHTKHSSNAYNENQRKNIYQNSSVYRFVKDDSTLASQLFSPEQLVSLKNLSEKNKGNQNAISLGLTTANDSSGKNKYMSKSIMINPDYERISMSYENYQRFLKDNNIKDEDVISAVDTEGRTHTYNSALDFLSAYENKQKGVEFDPDQLASILKERGLDPQLDLYRDQGAAVSMDSFIDNVSRLVSNHETARMVDEAASSKDKTVSSYAKRLRSSPQFMEKALDVVPQRNTIEKGLDFVGKFVTPIRLLFNAKNYAQGMITSGVQNLIGATIARNKKGALAGFSPVQIKEYNDPLVADTLYNNGFTEKSTLEWEGLPESWSSGITKASQISAGAIQEHNGKAAIALREMDNFLKDNKIDTNGSPKDIVSKWNEFAEKNGNDPTFLKKKVDIKMQTELIGDFGKFSRFKGMGIGRYTKDMKNWTVGQASSFMRDIGNLGDPQARKRLAIQMSPWVIATATAYAALPESEDRLEKALRIGSGIAFPPFGVYQLVQGSLGSSTVSAIKDVIAGGVKLGYIGMKEYSGDISDEEANKLYGEQLSRFTDALGADKAMNVIYSVYNIGKELTTGESSTPYHEAKATTLGAPVDYKNVTGAGYHKGKNITRATEDLMSSFVDMDYINSQQNFENLERYKNDPTYTNKEPSITKGTNIFQKILLGTSTPISDLEYAFKESPLGGIFDDQYSMEKSVQQRIDGMHVIDILNDIDKSKTLEDIMVRQDIPVEAKNAMLIAIENMTTSMEGQNVKTKESIPPIDTTIYTPKSSLTDNFNGYINELKDNNPYAYNRIIGGIAQLSKSINAVNLDGLNEYEKEQKINDLVTKAINPNNTGEQYIDAVIADRNNTKSLTTSYVNKVVDTISDMAWKKDGKEVSAEERMDLLNRLSGDIMNLSTNEYLVDSFGEAMTKLFTMENGRVKFLNGFFDKETLKDKMQNIIPFIINGLQVRGEQSGQNTGLPVMSSQTQGSMNGSSSATQSSPSSISDILGLGTGGIKIKPITLVQPKSQSGGKKIPSRGEAKSLAETLGIVKQQKSQPKVSQAKLATFSQK